MTHLLQQLNKKKQPKNITVIGPSRQANTILATYGASNYDVKSHRIGAAKELSNP